MSRLVQATSIQNARRAGGFRHRLVTPACTAKKKSLRFGSISRQETPSSWRGAATVKLHDVFAEGEK